MRYLSVCSGIEACTVAWHGLGWKAFAYSEIDKFPMAVLKNHYPDVPNLGDMTKFKEWPDAAIDVLVGGTPCQSFSVAGLRRGLDDPRGNLMLTYLAIADKYRPRWLVWENVPGVLSSNGGRDFACFLRGLAELGYGFAYRILDAQYFGVAQRRRRVFVVGHLGDWRRAAAVLFERHSLQGHPAPSRKAGQTVTPTIRAGAANGGAGHGARSGDSKDELIVPVAQSLRAQAQASHQADSETYIPVRAVAPIAWSEELTASVDCAGTVQYGGQGGRHDGVYIPAPHAEISPAIKARDSKGVSSDGDGDGAILVPMVAHALRGEGFDASEDGTGHGTPLVPLAFPERLSGTQCASAVAIHENQRSEISVSDTAGSLKCNGGKPGQGYPAVYSGMQVRRLTPLECCRLQGFPDDYLDIIYNGKPAADGAKYKALGNSMAVPVMAWLGRRINAVEEIKDGQ